MAKSCIQRYSTQGDTRNGTYDVNSIDNQFADRGLCASAHQRGRAGGRRPHPVRHPRGLRGCRWPRSGPASQGEPGGAVRGLSAGAQEGAQAAVPGARLQERGGPGVRHGLRKAQGRAQDEDQGVPGEAPGRQAEEGRLETGVNRTFASVRTRALHDPAD